MKRRPSEIEDHAIDLISDYLDAAESERTDILRRIAVDFVDLRQHHTTPDGSPDWGGRSHAYRQTINSVYRAANVPEARLQKLKDSIRYHTGNVLREKLSPEDLEAIGLRAVSPRERAVEKREREGAILGAFRTNVGSPEDVLRALTAARALMGRIRIDALADLTQDEREELFDLIAEIRKQANRIMHAGRAEGEAPRRRAAVAGE